jgi:hypothetical protein
MGLEADYLHLVLRLPHLHSPIRLHGTGKTLPFKRNARHLSSYPHRSDVEQEHIQFTERRMAAYHVRLLTLTAAETESRNLQHEARPQSTCDRITDNRHITAVSAEITGPGNYTNHGPD